VGFKYQCAFLIGKLVNPMLSLPKTNLRSENVARKSEFFWKVSKVI
jgi:hypothetical protein